MKLSSDSGQHGEEECEYERNGNGLWSSNGFKYHWTCPISEIRKIYVRKIFYLNLINVCSLKECFKKIFKKRTPEK